MKRILLLTTLLVAIVTGVMLTGCRNTVKPEINGSEHQPIMDGWTYEMAGEYWLQSALEGERSNVTAEGKAWMTPEQLASIDDENIQVRLPLSPEGTDPLPHNDRTYREAENGGFITFHLMSEEQLAADSALQALLRSEQLTTRQTMTVGTAELQLKETMYELMDTMTCYVQQRGRGIYTLYTIRDQGTTVCPDGYPMPLAAIIAVHPGADSLTICRGNDLGPNYIVEKK